MSFRLRLVCFLVLSLVAVQGLTAVLFYGVTRRALIDEGERRLANAGEVLVRQLDNIADQVANSVWVLALDYALRGAIAQRDQGTVMSALRNHGRRVGASRTLLLDLAGKILADTGEQAVGRFPFPELVEAGLAGKATAVVSFDGKVDLLVVVPVLAPIPIALIVAAIPVDRQFLKELQRLTSLPREVDLVAKDETYQWRRVASSDDGLALTAGLVSQRGELPEKPVLTRLGGIEYVALAVPLRSAAKSPPVAVLLGYSLDEALAPYRPVAQAWVTLMVIALLVGVAGAVLIARGVSRPIEALAMTARRIAGGDYRRPELGAKVGEIGELAAAFGRMTEAIAEREDHIRFQAEHDAVTGLPNRLVAEVVIGQGLKGSAAAVLMVGMARLPDIIKTMGHEIADRLMADAAGRIAQCAGNHFLARSTDSVFTLWLAEGGLGAARSLATGIVEILSVPYREADLAIDMAPAAGIALYPDHGVQTGHLLQHAEVALFAALGSDDGVCAYDPATDPHRAERLSLMGDLRKALDGGQLNMHYQPKLNLVTGRIDAAEALVRWTHPTRGFIPPDDFIGLAEETGNIRRLTRWALQASTDQASLWSDRGWVLRVAVNLSVRDLGDVELPRRIVDLLAGRRLRHDQVMMEITESAVMGEPETAIRVLKHLADEGIELAIDDFGVGQSSFAYLRKLPVREIKIDKSFVLNLAREAEDRTIVRSIVELGHRLGYRVTAEGVEDELALSFLADIGCDHAQGYFIAKPLAPAAFEDVIAGGRWAAKAWKAVS